MKKKDIVFIALWICGVVTTTLFKEWFKKILSLKDWNSLYFTIVVFGMLLLYIIFRNIPRVRQKIKDRKITFGKVESILNQYQTVSETNCFKFSRLDEDNLRGKLRNLRLRNHLFPWKRPMFFHTSGFRKNIFWVDYVYFRLLADFERLGFDVIVVIHNEDFIYEDGISTSPYFDENNNEFKAFTRNLHKALGYGSKMRFYCGQDFANRSKKLRKLYINLIYDRVVPYLSFVLKKLVDGIWEASFAHGEVINFIDSLVILCLPRRPILLSLYWERQAKKWEDPPLSTIKDEISMMMLISDVVEPKKLNSHVHDAIKRISLLDDEAEMKDKVFSSDDTILKTIAKVLFGLDIKEYIWEDWFDSLDVEKLKSEVHSKLSEMFPNIPEELQGFMMEIISTISSCDSNHETSTFTKSHVQELSRIYLRHQVLVNLIVLGRDILSQSQ